MQLHVTTETEAGLALIEASGEDTVEHDVDAEAGLLRRDFE